MSISTIQPSVLIVDDEALVRRTLRKSLSVEGFSCEEASNAIEALQCLRIKPSKVVILDIKMPGKPGYKILSEIKEHFPETSVVMATAVVEPEIIAQCMKAGADDYITKPFDVNQIVESIKRVSIKRKSELDPNRQPKILEEKLNHE